MPYKLKMLKSLLFRKSEGEALIKQAYTTLFAKNLNSTSPVNFSEKMFTRMINVNRDGDERFTRLADKYLARDYVREKVGESYLIELLWSGTDPEKIPFDSLPPRCVIKTNHGSGGNIILDGAVDRDEVKRKLKRWLKQNYYWGAREYHYYYIPRRILVETFLEDGEQNGPLDYRFWCFEGKPEVIQVDNHAHDINPFYDTNWNKLDMSYREGFKECDIKKPENFDEMLRVAAALSAEFDFVRVDLYNLKGQIYFGELTFTPRAGRIVFKPESWDLYLGEKWNFA